ncbi:hypothetical protein Psuf_060900 [Phytohabitans suffuscus]|uniref:Uncharacterized protein n=2 Tax=Phytohabitans suffuscus TaxID=624315 RepID=A0A6F8YRK0_9ACTN|nr:hypothetical protein Psuf_060900 [Phytohabitans suffuscus]
MLHRLGLIDKMPSVGRSYRTGKARQPNQHAPGTKKPVVRYKLNDEGLKANTLVKTWQVLTAPTDKDRMRLEHPRRPSQKPTADGPRPAPRRQQRLAHVEPQGSRLVSAMHDALDRALPAAGIGSTPYPARLTLTSIRPGDSGLVDCQVDEGAAELDAVEDHRLGDRLRTKQLALLGADRSLPGAAVPPPGRALLDQHIPRGCGSRAGPMSRRSSSPRTPPRRRSRGRGDTRG